MKLLFVGELFTPQLALLPYLSEHGYEVYIINLSSWFFPKTLYRIPVRNLYQEGTLGDVIRGRPSLVSFHYSEQIRLMEKAFLFGMGRFRDKLKEAVRTLVPQGQIDLIYGSWGSIGLQESWALRSIGLPYAYEFLTYPMFSRPSTVLLENAVNSRPIRALRGRILSTQNMQQYMKDTFGLGKAGSIVFSECYPQSFHYRKRLPLLSNLDGKPHIVYVAKYDANEILHFLQELSRSGVHIHVYDRTGVIRRLQGRREFENVHLYEWFSYKRLSDGQFATFLTQFDACLVTYPFRGVQSFQRFENSLPNRFTIALTSGIPLAVAGSLKGCGDFVCRKGIGFTFNATIELASKLHDTEFLGRLRVSAERFADSFTLENKFAELDNFLRQVADRTGPGSPLQKNTE